MEQFLLGRAPYTIGVENENEAESTIPNEVQWKLLHTVFQKTCLVRLNIKEYAGHFRNFKNRICSYSYYLLNDNEDMRIY